MSHDEYEGLLKAMIEKPDEQAETAKAILAEIDKDATARTDAEAKAKADYEALEAKLKDTEAKYKAEQVKNFLGQRGDDKPEKTLQDEVDEIIKGIINPPKKEEE